MALQDKKPDNQGLAIAGLIVNILVLPGLGSIIGGYQKTGVMQLVLLVAGFFVGLLLIFTIVGMFVGIPLILLSSLGAWVWSLITGIQMLQET